MELIKGLIQVENSQIKSLITGVKEQEQIIGRRVFKKTLGQKLKNISSSRINPGVSIKSWSASFKGSSWGRKHWEDLPGYASHDEFRKGQVLRYLRKGEIIAWNPIFKRKEPTRQSNGRLKARKLVAKRQLREIEDPVRRTEEWNKQLIIKR